MVVEAAAVKNFTLLITSLTLLWIIRKLFPVNCFQQVLEMVMRITYKYLVLYRRS